MTIERFEIENWRCIRRLVVEDLPPTGVIVLHGPNGTGKSSIIAALRACLMDYQSNSTADELKRSRPKNIEDHPAVTVTFRSDSATYRIKKTFGSGKSLLQTRTSTGDWKNEATTSKEAHERTRDLWGGCDSDKGLHQLLWLTQAEFHLPSARTFDEGIKGQLRNILGVLQTPLDDRFIAMVKKRWSVWFSGERKSVDRLKLKESSELAKTLVELCSKQRALQETDAIFATVEAMSQQLNDLEGRRRDLERQVSIRAAERERLSQQYERSQTRLQARNEAESRFANAQKAVDSAHLERQTRMEVVQRLQADEKAIAAAETEKSECDRKAESAVNAQKTLHEEVRARQTMRAEAQKQFDEIAARLKTLALRDQLASARNELERVEQLTQAIKVLEQELERSPAPSEATLAQLKENRSRAAKIRADLDAAALSLTLIPGEGASKLFLALDGAAPVEPSLVGPDQPIRLAVRRTADLSFPDWGRVELRRGSDSRNIEEVEDDLRKLEAAFAELLAPFGIQASDPQALDKLLERTSAKRVREPDLEQRRKDLKKIAPKGAEPLRQKIVALEAKIADTGGLTGSLTTHPSELELLSSQGLERIKALDEQINALETSVREAAMAVSRAQKRESEVREQLAGCRAKAERSREELARLPAEEQTKQRLSDAESHLQAARKTLEQTELTDEERTIKERLDATETALQHLELHLRRNADERLVLKTKLEGQEGLHPTRAALAAEVDQLLRKTERETLERDAVERLYALFEECKDKRLGALMLPIEKRVIGWMNRLKIGNYQELRFGENFLPQTLLARGGAVELTLGEESTGTQEQIGMLVRLALGATLSRPEKPAVAMLDDPLTHSDYERLTTMQAILRRAANGDVTSQPPAGPLQIFVFTCHPEWFEGTRTINLADPNVMTRFVT